GTRSARGWGAARDRGRPRTAPRRGRSRKGHRAGRSSRRPGSGSSRRRAGDARAHTLRGRGPAWRLFFVRGANEVGQMGALGIVELERAANSFEHLLGDTPRDASLEARVPLDADPGAERDLLTPQPGHPSLAAIPR